MGFWLALILLIACYYPEKGGFAAAILSHKTYAVVILYGEGYIVKDGVAVVYLRDIFK